MSAASKPLRRVRFEGGLVALALLYLFVFSFFPILYTIVMSFQEVDLFSLASFNRPFVGWTNYAAVFADPQAGRVFWNTVIFVALSVAFQLSIGLALAIYFQQRFPGAATMRGLFLAGWIMPGLVVGGIWKWILAGDYGVLNAALTGLGLLDQRIFWLSDPAFALYAIIIANIWLGIPFNMLLLSVGLSAIPDDLYEAAALDGVPAWKRFLRLTLPLMRATIGAVTALGVILTLQQFDLVAALTQGGPGNASNLAQYWSWQLSFQTYEISLGSTVAVLMIAVVLAVAALYTRSTSAEQSA